MNEKKRREKTKSSLSKTQAVTYSREFRMADRVGGYTDKPR